MGFSQNVSYIFEGFTFKNVSYILGRPPCQNGRDLSHTIFDTPSFTPLCHTPAFTHTVTDHLSHTIFHTPLCLTLFFTTPSFTHHFVTPSFTHNFVAHHLSPHQLSQTTLSHTIFRHTIFHTPLCHTPSFTHNFHTHSHHLSHTTLSHIHTYSHTIFLCHTPSFTYNFVTHNFVLLLGPPPPALFFLPSPCPLQHVLLIIGRSCLVGLSGPLISMFANPLFGLNCETI